ncbi:MAG: Hsp33 family molecular chaperone HslO [Deltaproteobacteria bacterium]|nr:Hsp33 family molecular chaperone HslO [Deltaproteobacteria bacterium]
MIKKDIFKKDVKEQFKASAKDRIYRFVMADKTIRGAVVHSTRMVNEMRANHDLGPLETLVLGQGYIAASLLCSGLKDKNDRVSIDIKCSGPVKGMDVESNIFGEVRGYLKTGRIRVKHPKKVKYLSSLYGAGFLTVTKYLENAPTPYSGQVALEHGSIAEDLANYFLVSEQIPSGFKLSVFFNEREEVAGAGGIFLQALPGADGPVVAEAEEVIKGIDSLGELFAKGKSPENIIQKEFSGLDPQFLTSTRVEFYCRCSKDRMFEYLKDFSKQEKTDMMKNGPFPLEVRCHYCNSLYCFSKDELQLF